MITVFGEAPEQGKEYRKQVCDLRPIRLCLRAVGEPKFLEFQVQADPALKKTSPEDEVFLVRVKGLEPSQPCDHKNLNLTRLPIPPNPHMKLTPFIFTRSKVSEVHKQSLSRYFVIITQKRGLVKRKNKIFPPIFLTRRLGVLTYYLAHLTRRRSYIDF